MGDAESGLRLGQWEAAEYIKVTLEEMAPWFKVLAALAKDQSPVLSTHLVAHSQL